MIYTCTHKHIILHIMNCVRITCFQKPRIMTVCLLHFSQLQSKYIDIDLGNYSLQHVLKWSLRNIPHPLGHHNLIIVKQNVSEIFFNTHRIKIRQVCFLLKMCCSPFFVPRMLYFYFVVVQQNRSLRSFYLSWTERKLFLYQQTCQMQHIYSINQF